jgi:hypothetical protein
VHVIGPIQKNRPYIKQSNSPLTGEDYTFRTDDIYGARPVETTHIDKKMREEQRNIPYLPITQSKEFLGYP